MRESAYVQCLWIKTGEYRHKKMSRVSFLFFSGEGEVGEGEGRGRGGGRGGSGGW